MPCPLPRLWMPHSIKVYSIYSHIICANKDGAGTKQFHVAYRNLGSKEDKIIQQHQCTAERRWNFFYFRLLPHLTLLCFRAGQVVATSITVPDRDCHKMDQENGRYIGWVCFCHVPSSSPNLLLLFLHPPLISTISQPQGTFPRTQNEYRNLTIQLSNSLSLSHTHHRVTHSLNLWDLWEALFDA